MTSALSEEARERLRLIVRIERASAEKERAKSTRARADKSLCLLRAGVHDRDADAIEQALAAITAQAGKTRDGSTPQTLSPAPRGEEGWVLVPKKLTAAMWSAANSSGGHFTIDHTMKLWKALLAAAPKAPEP